MLSDVRDKNVDKLIIGCININFLENKFEPIRLNRNSHGGGIMVYIRDDLPNKELKSHKLPNSIESSFIEITLGKNKRLIMGGYTPH